MAVEPHRPGAQHRRGDDGRRARRPVAQDHGGREAAKSSQLKNTINTMVDQLNGFAAEVTRVAREVGTEGKLGGQAKVPRRGRAPGRISPDNVNVDGQQPDRRRCATSPRS